jgi:uncharacterized protein
MLFDIKEIGDEGLSLDLPVTAAWLAAECPDLDAVPVGGGLRVRGQLLLSGDDVFLRGSLRGTLETTCSRCLEKAKVPVDIPLNVTFRPRAEGEDGGEDDEDEEDLDVALYEGDEVDLGPELRDQLFLAFPLKPLCREDCLGLCPVCGGNRNQVPCACESQPSQVATRTPLAAALEKLKKS